MINTTTNNNIVNDMFLATIRNPNAKTYDFLNNNVNPLNTQLLDKDDYRDKDSVKNQFTKPDGAFDEVAFDNAYKVAAFNFNQIANEEAVKNLDNVKYSPFDSSRPKAASVWDVDIKFSTDINPYRQLYSRDGINTITESSWSIREIAQMGKVYDTKSNQWLESANKKGLIDKFFGDTLVYAQWDEDGVHVDPESGNTVNHKKGDWKLDNNGQLYLETLGDREIYGKQIVSPTDILTTDGSIFNKFDFFDSDGREKSIGKTAIKTIVEIAPLLIPGVNTWYGGARAAIGLTTVLPTFYKSLESLLLGDNNGVLSDPATKAEGWLAKFNQQSTSDKGSEGFWNYEAMSGMITSIFSQIYEQRAMASLSKYLIKPTKLLDARTQELQLKMTAKALAAANKHGINAADAISDAVKNLPELQNLYKQQSQISKALSLGYMALTSTGDVYGEAIDSGYDRRTAGFASLLTASGQYGIMMNNRMGDWFLDKTTGYNIETNRALMKKSVKPWLKEINDIFKDSGLSTEVKRAKLASVAVGFKRGLNNLFTGSSVLGEAMFKNMVIEGIEEVTEQVVEDASKAVIDVMNYLGLTKGKGDFRTLERYASGEAFQEYLANFVGGVLGGGLFELERSKISPWLTNRGATISPETRKSIYELVAGGHKNELINMIKSESKNLTNDYLSYIEEDGEYKPKTTVSQSDLVTQKAIEIIEQIDSTLNSEGLNLTDEEIIDKAIRDKVIITQYDKLKPENKYLGYEALVLNDFKNTVAKIEPLKAEILTLEQDAEKNKEQIKVKKDELKEYSQKVNNILSGEYGMKYFNQLSFALSSALSSKYGSFDKNTYTKAKYNKEFSDLPTTGVVSQETVTEEWNDFLDSVDIKEKLELATKVFLENEQLINPTIWDYKQTGYSQERDKVYKSLVDIVNTAKLFTNEDPQQKIHLFNHFIKTMNELENNKFTKFGPWDVLLTNIFEEFETNGLLKIGNYSVDDTGQIIKTFEDVTPEFLNSATTLNDGSTITNRDKYKSIIEEVIKKFPSEAFNTKSMINTYNSIVDTRNQDVLNSINKLEQKANKTEEDLKAIESLKGSLIEVQLGTIDDVPKIKEIKNIFRDSTIQVLEEHFPEIFSTNQTQEEKILEVEKEILNYRAVKANEVAYNKILNEIIKEELGNVKENFEDYNKEELYKIFSRLSDIGLIYDAAVALNNESEISTILEELFNLESSEFNSHVLKQLFEYTDQLIKKNQNILNNPTFNIANKKLEELTTKMNSEVLKNTPEIMKIRNVAFVALVRALDSGILDREVFNLAKEHLEAETNSYIKTTFKNFDNLSITDLLLIIDKRKELLSLVRQINVSTFFEDETGLEEINPELHDLNLERLIDLYSALNSGNYDDIINLSFNHIIEESEYEFFSTNFKEIVGDNWNIFRKVLWSVGNLDEYGDTVLNNVFDILNNENFGKSVLDNYDALNKHIAKADSFISNPLYDYLRKYFLTLNSGQKPLAILDILQREITSYNASSGASSFISDNIREQDVKQAIEMLELLKVNIMSASQTDFNDESLGFITMRQNFARKNNLKDDVLNLKTISSEEGYTMIKDIDRIIIKLEFLSGLATFNQKRLATEHKEIGLKLDSILLDNWDTIIKNEIGKDFIPLSALTEIMNSDKSSKQKLHDIEDAVYEHNKNRKIDAFKGLMRNFDNVQIGAFSTITKDMSPADFTEIDFITYLGSVLSVKTSEFLKYRYNSLAKENKAPFYMQELVSKITYSSIINPDLFSEIFNVKKDVYKGNVDLITIILGSAGSGKTTAIMGSVIDIIRQTNPKSNIWLSAPSEVQTNNLNKAINDATGSEGITYSSFNKKALFAQFGEAVENLYNEIQQKLSNLDQIESFTLAEIKENPEKLSLINFVDNKLYTYLPEDIINKIDFSTLPNLLLIDEVTHFSNSELQLLNLISEASKNADNTNFMKIVAMGDQNQLGFTVNYKGSYYNYNIEGINAVFTPLLLTTVRADNDQKRINNDILLNLSSVSDKISRGLTSAEAMNARVRERLSDVNTETGLKYFLSNDDFKGDYIIKSYDTIEPFKVVSALRKKNPDLKIGVLTERGEINPDLLNTLTKIGINEEDLILFDPKTIQGSEVDYLIFDTAEIFKYNRLKEQLRALYTFASRSTSGSIIVDPENKISQGLMIENATKSEYYRPYDLLTTDVIKSLKDERVTEITDLLKGDLKNVGEVFKWLTGKVISEPDNNLAFGVEANSNLFLEKSEDGTNVPKEQEDLIKKSVKSNDFKMMLHSFYNSPGAKLSTQNGKPIKLEIDPNMPRFDLNGLTNISDVNRLQSVINQWLKLKYSLLYEKPVNSLELKDYLGHIFKEDFNNVTPYDVEYMVTVQRYNDEYHDPYAKYEGDSDKYLKNSNLFLNLTAKITINDKSHFITLATFGTRETLLNKGIKYVDGDTTDLVTKINAFYDKLETDIPLDDFSTFKQISTIKPENFSFISGTRIVSKDKNNKTRHLIHELKNKIPGLQHSVMGLFPGNLESFRNHVNKYTFGEIRGDKSIEELFQILANKPYIVVSFDNNLNGSSNNAAQAKLMPVGSNARDIKTVINEILSLREEVVKDIKSFYDINPNGKYVVNKKINAKFETILNASQILDILITWGKASSGKSGETLLDLLIKPIQFEGQNEVYQNNKTILDVLNNFKETNSKELSTTKQLSTVIERIKEVIKDNPDESNKEIKKLILKKISKLTGWNWNFYNFFVYSDIIDKDYIKRIKEMKAAGFIDKDSDVSSKGIDEMKSNIKKLFNVIKNFNFYYSIPIQKGEDGSIEVNEFIGGKHGFSTEFFADKFFISGTPEGPRLLLDFNSFVKSTPTTLVETSTEPIVDIEEEIVPTDSSVIDNVTYSDITSLELETINGDIVKPFSTFFSNNGFVPNMLEGAESMGVKTEAENHIQNAINAFSGALKIDNGISQREKTIMFLTELTKFTTGNSKMVGGLPTTVGLIKSFWGEKAQSLDVKKRSNLFSVVNQIIDTLKNCK